MDKVFYKPHVGKNYETNKFNDIRLLILGESHYCDGGCEICGLRSNKDCSDFTTDVLNRYFNYKKGEGKYERWMRTFTSFTNVILGGQVADKTILDFWDSVIFYNYVQSCTIYSRISPTNQQFRESEEAFFSVLKTYNPDLIIAWGKRLWQNLPRNGRWGEEKILDNKFEGLYYFNVGEVEIPAFCVPHPSTRYFTYEYSKYFEEVFELIKSLKHNCYRI